MRPTKRTSHILIAEGNSFFRRGLRALFSSDPAFVIVGETSEVQFLQGQIQKLRPHVLVLNTALLQGEDHEALGVALRKTHPTVQVLLVAEDEGNDTMSLAMALGAKGLVLRSTDTTGLLAALRTVAFGEGGMNQAGLLPEFVALEAQTSTRPATPPVLTAREQEVVRLLADGKTVRLVAKELSLSMKTVEAHKLNLMRKLNIHDRTTLVAYANRAGLMANQAA